MGSNINTCCCKRCDFKQEPNNILCLANPNSDNCIDDLTINEPQISHAQSKIQHYFKDQRIEPTEKELANNGTELYDESNINTGRKSYNEDESKPFPFSSIVSKDYAISSKDVDISYQPKKEKEEKIIDGVLCKYTNYNGKISSINRYCQLTNKKFKYFKNDIQGTEWLAKPLGEYNLINIKEVNYIKIETKKKERSSLPGIEIIIKSDGQEEQAFYFACDSDRKSLYWVDMIRQQISKQAIVE